MLGCRKFHLQSPRKASEESERESKLLNFHPADRPLRLTLPTCRPGSSRRAAASPARSQASSGARPVSLGTTPLILVILSFMRSMSVSMRSRTSAYGERPAYRFMKAISASLNGFGSSHTSPRSLGTRRLLCMFGRYVFRVSLVTRFFFTAGGSTSTASWPRSVRVGRSHRRVRKMERAQCCCFCSCRCFLSLLEASSGRALARLGWEILDSHKRNPQLPPPRLHVVCNFYFLDILLYLPAVVRSPGAFRHVSCVASRKRKRTLMKI